MLELMKILFQTINLNTQLLLLSVSTYLTMYVKKKGKLFSRLKEGEIFTSKESVIKIQNETTTVNEQARLPTTDWNKKHNRIQKHIEIPTLEARGAGGKRRRRSKRSNVSRTTSKTLLFLNFITKFASPGPSAPQETRQNPRTDAEYARIQRPIAAGRRIRRAIRIEGKRYPRTATAIGRGGSQGGSGQSQSAQLWRRTASRLGFRSPPDAIRVRREREGGKGREPRER